MNEPSDEAPTKFPAAASHGNHKIRHVCTHSKASPRREPGEQEKTVARVDAPQVPYPSPQAAPAIRG